jgi:plasmid stabilization system protein ParE
MAELIWTEPALSNLDAIADFIALDKPAAAKALVQRIISHVEQLAEHPESASSVRELPRSPYRQIVEPPCRIFYRYEQDTAYILHVMRAEMLLRKGLLKRTSDI